MQLKVTAYYTKYDENMGVPCLVRHKHTNALGYCHQEINSRPQIYLFSKGKSAFRVGSNDVYNPYEWTQFYGTISLTIKPTARKGKKGKVTVSVEKSTSNMDLQMTATHTEYDEAMVYPCLVKHRQYGVLGYCSESAGPRIQVYLLSSGPEGTAFKAGENDMYDPKDWKQFYGNISLKSIKSKRSSCRDRITVKTKEIPYEN